MDMKRIAAVLIVALLLTGCAQIPSVPETTSVPEATMPKPEVFVPKVEQLSEDFVMGADVSSLLSLERSGVVFRDREGAEADLIGVLHDAGIDHIRVRIWKDPYDAQGRGYGGGNCDLDNAIAIGQRAAKYGMKVLADLHYSDFWADPGKQQVPKAWEGMDFGEKEAAVRQYTKQTLEALLEAGVDVDMVQIGNETTGGFCGEWTVEGQYRLMAAAAETVRSVSPRISVVVHYTDPQKGGSRTFAQRLQDWGVDYDIFATSYYPCWHGSLEGMIAQLEVVARAFGKKVMVAETSWPYTTVDTDGHRNSLGAKDAQTAPYPFSVQGQATALYELIDAMARLGDPAVGVFYWEPAWIAVPGNSWEERSRLWEEFGSGWASSYAGAYDPEDAGKYHGGSACDDQALFDKDGQPLASLWTFRYVRTGEVEGP